ncbi:MAG TPA: N-acetylmuramoyl-L-alanine amidase [Kiritimatiellia bacterium]|nr:N-acetylmuramoyl-L-alanine amidase [Kiritimatiellia bacterium]HRU71159.1 N-acetylmuramoyl-L-alanine amidase [Kiritimatiellia bacterium]
MIESRFFLIWLCVLVTGVQALSASDVPPSVRVTFPAAGATVSTTTQTYLIGSVTPPDTPLTVNAQTVTPWRTGGFICMVKVVPGTNTVVLRAGAAEHRHTFRVPEVSRSDDDSVLRVIEPTQPTGVYTGESVRLAGRAPAGRQVFAAVGERTLPLSAARDAPTRYSTAISFPAPADNVPVVFFSDGLPDVPAAPVTARATWPTHEVTGPLFAARARTEPGGGETVAFMTPGLRVQGAGYIGRHVRFWLGGEQCFIESDHLTEFPDLPLPPRDLAPPDLTVGFATRPPSGRQPADILVVLDPGHGGPSTGAISPTGVTEKEVNLRQALLMRDVLERAGFRVLMTRDRDVDVDLYERVRIAYRAKADAFISVHHNATAAHTDPRSVRHISTYAWNEIGLHLARAIHPKLAAVTPIPDRGVLTASFAVCRNPAIPSCLLELDFINCPEGEEAIQCPERQRRVAEALLEGLRTWLTPFPQLEH